MSLDKFRKPGLCEYCGRPCPDGRDPHHVWTRGAGTPDDDLFLVSLCRICHTGFHTSGKPSRAELVAIVSEREGKTPEEIERVLYEARRQSLKKGWEL